MKNRLIMGVLCCSIALPATADDPPAQVAGATNLVDPESVELFEEYDFQSTPGKLHFTLKLKPDQLYLPVHVASLHPFLTDGDPSDPYYVYPRILRSMRLGNKVGVLLRYGAEVGGTNKAGGPNFPTDYRVFLTSQRNLKSWFAQMRLNMIIFRKGVVQHPQGAGFLSFNRYAQLSGPMADDLLSVFVMANTNEAQDRDRLRVFNKNEWGNWGAYNYDWVTLHGTGTTLTVWINGEQKSLEASSNNARENTFKLSQKGIRLADVDRLPGAAADLQPGETSFTVPRLKITAPQLTWVSGATKSSPPAVDADKNPTDSVTIPPDAKVRRNLTGRWESKLGQTDLVQTGTKVVGTIRYTGLSTVGVLDGQLTGTRLDFTAHVSLGEFSHGYVNFLGDGNSGEGPYITADGTQQMWKLNR